MTHHVAVPFWLLLIVAVLALWAFVEHFLTPSLRWFFRRRVNEVIQEINTRLKIEIPSFKLTRREVVIDRLFHDPAVQQAARNWREETKAGEEEVNRKVDRYAREIVPSFNAYLYFRLGYRCAKGLAKFLYRVRLGYSDSQALASVNPKSSVVFVMNHRSNMDYILVAFLAAERTALSYAVGEWARVWPLQGMIKSLGAYFVRRNSKDALYRAVLQRYVQMATEAGVCQAVFPEGGLTVDGKLRAPKLGLLDYMVKNFDPHGERDLVFVPVGVNYDRVLEDRTLMLKQNDHVVPPGIVYALFTSFKFLLKNLWRMLIGRWYRFGYACVNFGPPLSMRRYVGERNINFRAMDEDERHKEVEQLGQRVMTEIGRVVPVTPVALVASVFAQNPGKSFSELELKFVAFGLMTKLERQGAHLYVPRQDHDYAITVGLRMLILRDLVTERDGLFSASTSEIALLRYYANSIAHFIDP
jgi:glycerol-3-phosphate O-acyltransferase